MTQDPTRVRDYLEQNIQAIQRIHIAEVGWMLQDAGLDAETVAAGFLHDIIEDCGYTQGQLAQEIGNAQVAEIVKWVSEDKLHPIIGEKQSWEARNKSYLERLKSAPDNVRALSCADKTSNMRDMNRLLAKGHPSSSFTKQDHATQLNKFESLYEQVFADHVPEKIAARYQAALNEFQSYGK